MKKQKSVILFAKLIPFLENTIKSSTLSRVEKEDAQNAAMILLLLLRKAVKKEEPAPPIVENQKRRLGKRNRLFTQFLAGILRDAEATHPRRTTLG